VTDIQIYHYVSKDSLEELKKELRIIFTQNDNTIYKLMGVFDKYGIKFCIVEKTDHASIDGYSFMDSNGIPSIVVTTRFKRIDNLAFAVMHEVCHVFNHLSISDYQRINIFDEDVNSKEEKEANDFASNALIPQELWNSAPQVTLNPFVIQKKYSQWAYVNNLNKWIVLGRISHETGMCLTLK
jgi:HTH-type transcriptional regulator/antitoxin HigA